MHAISIIIPSYNAASWLPSTVGRLKAALKKGGIEKYEIIIVDDGSGDSTKEIVAELHRDDARIIGVHQENKGRFMARKAGIDRAKYDYVLFIDSRIYIDEDSLLYVKEQMSKNSDMHVWNGHVRIKLGWNVFARFWDAVTFIAWRRYLRKPRLVQYGIDDFDYFPKGTTMFLAPRELLLKYIKVFKANINDLRFVSDDTALLRNLAKEAKITISPNFSCLYHSRDRLSAFLKHTLNRGTFFVDGFLQPGNRFFLMLVAFLIVSPLGLVALLIWPAQILLAALVIWILEATVAILLGVSLASAASLWLLTPLFAFLYGLGIWRGVFMLMRQKRGLKE